MPLTVLRSSSPVRAPLAVAGRRTARRGRALVACVLGVALLGVVAVTSYAAKDDTRLVSRATGVAGAKGDANSDYPSISGDGRYVVFHSSAANLDPADSDATPDVFVRDLQTATTRLVSRASGATGAKGNGESSYAVISSDGRYVTFQSSASNLDPGDGDATSDVFVRDLQAHTTTLVSRADGAAGTKSNGYSGALLSISRGGRYVAFSSAATNLDLDDPDAAYDVFVRDLQAHTTTLVSRASGAAGANANDHVGTPTISADGRYVAFVTSATNLDPAVVDDKFHVYLRDLQAATTTLVSRASGAAGVPANSLTSVPAISADGRYVAFESFASNLTPADSDRQNDVFVRDLQAATTTLVSRATGASGENANDHSGGPAISADGRYVAFHSDASNLATPTSAELQHHVYVRDRQAATTTLVSRASGATGARGDRFSVDPVISADGRFVAFTSGASNLDPDDTDNTSDVFVRDVLGDAEPPSCPDIRADASTLWPANHQFRRVRVHATDAQPGAFALQITAVTQDEPVDGAADARRGDTRDEVWLRAERDGRGDGRIYRIDVQATDVQGRSCSRTVTVAVPHDRHTPAVDSGGSFDSLSD